MNFDTSLIPNYFPFPEFRSGQQEVIQRILDSFASGKKFFVLEAPTGAGKSAIGLTIAQFFNSSFYLTIVKMLQSQIMNDFSERLPIIDLKGRTNYECNYYSRNQNKLQHRMSPREIQNHIDYPPDCNSGFCRTHRNNFRCEECFPESLPFGHTHSTCPYYERVGETIASPIALMNFSNFLYQTRLTNRFTPRELLLLDEAHSVEPQLLNFVSITISDRELQTDGFKLTKFDLPEEYACDFMDRNIIGFINSQVRKALDAGDVDKQDQYTLLYRKIQNFITSVSEGDEWICELTEIQDPKSKAKYHSLLLKPVFVQRYANDYLFKYGTKVLLMSATILDPAVYMSSLGIPANLTTTYRMTNRFPVANRPIFYTPAAKIVGGKRKQPEWGPKLVKKVDKILSDYPDVRGIVHTHNFSIAEEIVTTSSHRKRMLFQKDYPTKEDMLQEHAQRPNGILVAPAMHEGLDLKEELSRLQIVCKVPWPNFMEDAQLARRVEIDRRYLLWLVALKITQSVGRSVRSEKDWAHTYIIDAGFEDFVSQAYNMLPNWFHDAVIRNEDVIAELAAIRGPELASPDLLTVT